MTQHRKGPHGPVPRRVFVVFQRGPGMGPFGFWGRRAMTASNGHKNGKRQSLVLYGKDERGKPRAACFAARDALLARRRQA